MISSDERLAAIVDSSSDAIISKDLDSIISTWNAAAERLFGYSAEEAIGQSILMLIPQHLQHEEADIIARIKRGERVATFETLRRRKDGALIQVSLTVSPVKNASGQIVGASKIARDITAAKESERRIRLLLREVNHRVKNQYAVILSIIRETSNRSKSPAEFESIVRQRIAALSRSHDLLVESDWKGASLFELVRQHLATFGVDDRVLLSGQMLALHANAVQPLGMAIHELGTNSAKYGALAQPSGQVSVHWKIVAPPGEERQLEIVWEETYVPAAHPADQQPSEQPETENRKGFGTVVLLRVTPRSLNGTATLEREPGHVVWRLVAPLSTIIEGAEHGAEDPHLLTHGS